MTYFFICSIKSPQWVSKKIFGSDFPSPCFDVPNTSNFTSGGVQNRETRNRRLGTIVTSFQDSKLWKNRFLWHFCYFLISNVLLYHFLANWLAHNKKMSEKSVFRKAWSPEWRHNHSQCLVFGLVVLNPTGSEIWLIWYTKTWGRKIAINWKFFFAIHIRTLRRFNQTNKKKSVIYTLKACSLRYSWRLKCTFQNLAIYFCNLHKLTISLIMIRKILHNLKQISPILSAKEIH